MATIASRVKRLRFGDSVVRRNPVFYPLAIRLFNRLERASLDQRRLWTEVRLRKLLRAAQQTPYGHRFGSGPRIEDWPILEKAQIHDEPQAFVRGATWTGSHATTSGTTGLPLHLWRSFSSISVEQATIDRLLQRVGIKVRDYRAAVLRGDDIKSPTDQTPPYWVLTGGGRRLIFSSNHLTARTLPAFIDALENFKPDALHAYPTILESLCLLLQAAGRRVHIPVTICSSEVLPERTWQMAAELLDTKLVDYYGQAERLSFAYAFAPTEYCFLAGYSYNELIPHSGDGEWDVYELICTGLWNTKMPLVRLRTGDLIRVQRPHDLVSVRYGVRPFQAIVGRSGDFLIAPDGARLMGIDHIPRGIDGIVRMQVIQETLSRVKLLVIAGPGFSDGDRAAIMKNASMKLPPSMSVEIEMVSQLRRSANNKVPFVIRRVDQ